MKTCSDFRWCGRLSHLNLSACRSCLQANRVCFYYNLFTAVEVLHQCPVAVQLCLSRLQARVTIHNSCSPRLTRAQCRQQQKALILEWDQEIITHVSGASSGWMCIKIKKLHPAHSALISCMFGLVYTRASWPANNTSRRKSKLIVLHKVMAWGSGRKRGEQRKRWLLPEGGDSGGGGVDTPGWPWRPRCRSHWGPLATRVNTDDFSVCPYELTLLGETQEVGLEQWQCQGG